MALDLGRGRIKLLSQEGAYALFDGIPREYQRMICRAHLPWGQAGNAAAAYQVVVRHPSLQRIFPDEPVEILTTNLWLDPVDPWPEDLIVVFAQAASLLMRMGHRGDCRLHHGAASMRLEQLACLAISSPDGGACPADESDWALLEEVVIPAVSSGAPLNSETIQQLGPEWAGLFVEIERSEQ